MSKEMTEEEAGRALNLGKELEANRPALERGFADVCNALGIEPDGEGLDGLAGSLLEWGKAAAAELGCEPKLDAILEAMKSQKAPLDLEVSKLSERELALCRKSAIDPRKYAATKARVKLGARRA